MAKYVTHSFGVLWTAEGNSYYMLKTHPIDRYPWQLDNQQMWYVVKREWSVDDEGVEITLTDYHPVGHAFQLVTTSPTIEFLPEDIEVETVGLEENNEESALDFSMTPEEIEEYEKQQLRFDEIFA